MRTIEEFEKRVKITGFRNIRIENVEGFIKASRNEKLPDVEIQFFNAQYVATWQHLYFAALNALTAFNNGENLSKNIAVETLLYASAQRQIRKAMQTMGIRADTKDVAILIIGEKTRNIKSALTAISKHLKTEADDSVLELSNDKSKSIRKIFGISDEEVETIKKKNDSCQALVDLVIERMALLSTGH